MKACLTLALVDVQLPPLQTKRPSKIVPDLRDPVLNGILLWVHAAAAMLKLTASISNRADLCVSAFKNSTATSLRSKVLTDRSGKDRIVFQSARAQRLLGGKPCR